MCGREVFKSVLKQLLYVNLSMQVIPAIEHSKESRNIQKCYSFAILLNYINFEPEDYVFSSCVI